MNRLDLNNQFITRKSRIGNSMSKFIEAQREHKQKRDDEIKKL